MYKGGQAWGFDAMMASIIFIAGIIVFYLYSLNLADQTDETLNKMLYDGNVIAESFLSEGAPDNWDSTNVQKIGLQTNNKINDTKLEIFYQLSIIDYQKTKLLLNTNYNYYVFFQENITIDEAQIEGIGSIPTNPKNLIKITRVTIYKDKPTTISIDIWE